MANMATALREQLHRTEGDWYTYCPRSGSVASSIRSRVAAIAEAEGWWLADYDNSNNGPVFTLRRS